MKATTVTLTLHEIDKGEDVTAAPSPRNENEKVSVVGSMVFSKICSAVGLAASFAKIAAPDRKSADVYRAIAASVDQFEQTASEDPFLAVLFSELRQGTISINGNDLRGFDEFGKKVEAAENGSEVAE